MECRPTIRGAASSPSACVNRLNPQDNSTPSERRPRRLGRSPAQASVASHAPRRRRAAPETPLEVSADADQLPVSFDSLGLDPRVLKGVADRGFAKTTPIQAAVIPSALEGADIIACAETGTGKTAAFLLPILQRLIRRADGGVPIGGRTTVLVLTPTRELAVQIEDDIQGFAYHTPVSSVTVCGGLPSEPQERALKAGVDIVVATPGRLMDHQRGGVARFEHLEVLVLDEADRMMDMGFWPDVTRIVQSLPAARQTLLFSATMPDEVMSRAREIVRDPRFIASGTRNGPARTITHVVEALTSARKGEWLAKFLRRERGPVLVFVRTKRGADRLASRIISAGIRAAALHADRTQAQRTSAVEGLRSGRYTALIATDLAARGLDIDGITHVINYEVP
ncbi:MAG: DEAD/DEAH box helicase, partial [Acidobacteria bacterium]